MTAGRKKLLVVDVAALSRGIDDLGLDFRQAETVFPAVTCPAQASFRTAAAPARHGMVSNGVYRRDMRKVCFWEQSSALVEGERIWAGFRRRGGTVAILFWQQSLGEDVDAVLSPAPVHKHHGGMIEDCYSQPAGLYERLCDAVGGRFKLRHYWGPMASPKAGDWIAAATAPLLADEKLAPDLCLTYLPTLDYDLQRKDPAGPAADKPRAALRGQLKMLLDAAAGRGYEVLVFGDYAIAPVTGPTYPNRALAEAGLLKMRPVKDMLYPDFHASRAFAMVDHQVAHVYAATESCAAAAEVLSELPGVAEVMDLDARRAAGVDHANAGELVLAAEEGTWFAYPWWTDRRQAPDYAAHVDIHNKPGYDPCELLVGWPPGSVSQDAAKIAGSHGRVGPGKEIVWATTLPLREQPASIIDLARMTRGWLDEET